jgi:hypothetical protein
MRNAASANGPAANHSHRRTTSSQTAALSSAAAAQTFVSMDKLSGR